MQQPDEVSVVICGYTCERWGDIVEAIHSVQHQNSPPKEIIFVADHNAELLERVQTQLPGVIAVANGDEQGASAARNCGVSASSGQLIAFLDDDAVAASDWLDRLCEGYQDPNVLGVGGKIDPLWQGAQPRWLPKEFYWVIGATYRGMPEHTTCVRNLWTGNMSIRRDIFDSVDGFRTGFGKTGARSSPEDTDFCIRVGQRWPDGDWLYKPDAVVLHKVPPSRSNWRYFLRRCYNEGLGKAHLSRLVGTSSSMKRESRHAVTHLPLGVFRALIDMVRHRDPSGLGRAVAIIAGLGAATLGYVAGMIQK